FILRFFDLQRILTVLAGMAAVLMYLFITGTQAHMPWFILTLGKHAQHSQAPVVKEKWGIGVLFLAIAALCYILGQLGFISWV
ncbi:hypothetical protein ACXGXA_24895, partial [Salmonella enterica subsp. enterica serovar Infantis]